MGSRRNHFGKHMKALVISGGGSKGAFAGGVAEYLINEQKNEYDLYVGTSTGSLLVPLLASNNITKAKEIYTNVRQEDIFSTCPFIIKKKKGIFKTRFNHLGIISMFLRGKKTLGDSQALLKFIRSNFSEKEFDQINEAGKCVVATVANFTKQRVEHKSSQEYKYDDFCEWIWASANMLPFMSIVYKDDCEYGDGGFGNLIPIQEAINRGAESVDVIILQPSSVDKLLPPANNAFQVITRTYDFMFRQIAKDDVTIGNLAAQNKHVDIHFYYTPRLLTEHSFIFDKELMTGWWQEGYDSFKDKSPEKIVVKLD